MIKYLAKVSTVLCFLILSYSVHAEPRTVSVAISKMRPYTTGDYFVTVDSNSMTDNTTCSTVYRVQPSDPGAKAVIASLLTAYALGQNVQIEIPTSTGCAGFGTPITSVFLSQ